MTPEQCEEAALLAEVYAQQFGDLTKTGLLSFARWLRTMPTQTRSCGQCKHWKPDPLDEWSLEYYKGRTGGCALSPRCLCCGDGKQSFGGMGGARFKSREEFWCCFWEAIPPSNQKASDADPQV